LSEWRSLAEDRNPVSFFNGVLSMGDRLFREGRVESAGQVHTAVAEALSRPDLSRLKNDAALMARVRSQRELLTGRAPWQAQLPALLHQLGKEIKNPITFGGMLAGNFAGGAVRLAAYTRNVDRLAHLSPFARLWGVHAGAATLGLGADVSAFVGAVRGLEYLAGHDLDWSFQALRGQWAGAALMFGGMRGANLVSRFLLGQIPLAAGSNVLGGRFGLRAAHFVVPQTAMLLGLMGVHGLEASWNSSAPQTAELLALKSLATLLHFNLTGKMMEAALGPRYLQMNRDLNFQLEILLRRLKSGLTAAAAQLMPSLPQHLTVAGGPPWRMPFFGGLRDLVWNISNPRAASGGVGGSSGSGAPREQPVRRQAAEEPLPVEEAATPDGERTSHITPMTPPPLEAVVGMKFGSDSRYQITGQIGDGGVSKVFEVYDWRLSRNFALKVLRPESVADAELVLRFEREARILAGLERSWHPQVYDFLSLPTGQYAMMLELIRGYDWHTLINGIHRGDKPWRGYFPLERLIATFCELCRAVDYTHRQGIVHRDIKPENVMLRLGPTTLQGDQVFVIDYGVAKNTRHPEPQANLAEAAPANRPTSEALQTITRDGLPPGTAGYLAPELFFPASQRQSLNPEALDVFALGVTFYKWVTGIQPFSKFQRGDKSQGQAMLVPRLTPKYHTELDLSYMDPRHASRVHPPGFAQVIPRGLYDPRLKPFEALAFQAMRLDPAARYPSVQDFLSALETVMDRHGFPK
jgi:serine/threonine protein kinase